ncbi:hypothetical protein [Micromonospora chalcea]|uniref:hypothetical protein n=1 Tax=Micromonospora chalcea TaxID=1874 RepID=UPI00157CA10E|nr:hypothetical protein [Micromonospora chalcea]
MFGEEQVPENANKFRPHVSVAYLTADGFSAPYVETVSSAKGEKARATIAHVDLIEMHRDRQMYEWQTVEALPLA